MPHNIPHSLKCLAETRADETQDMLILWSVSVSPSLSPVWSTYVTSEPNGGTITYI